MDQSCRASRINENCPGLAPRAVQKQTTPRPKGDAIIIEKPDPQEQLQFLEKAVSEWGWAVFPLHKIKRNYKGDRVWCGCRDGMTCNRVGKCPRVKWGDRANHIQAGGVKTWIDDGFTNFGIHLGWSGLVVLDVDARHGGPATFSKIVLDSSTFQESHVATAGGGFHVYYRSGKHFDPIKGLTSPSGKTSTNIPLGSGCELLSGQHFVVAPYSVHKSGVIYKPCFDNGFSLFQGEVNEPDVFQSPVANHP